MYAPPLSRNIRAPLYCLVGLRHAGWKMLQTQRNLISFAMILTLSVNVLARRRTQHHRNRRRQVLRKTGSDIHAASTVMSVRFKGQLWRKARSMCRCFLSADLPSLKHPHHWEPRPCTRQRRCFAKVSSSKCFLSSRCEQTPPYDDETRSPLTSMSTTNLASFTESVSAHVYNQVHQKQNVCESPSRSK